MAELSTLGSVIKTAYEGEADTNAFTDADHTKLDGIETAADVTDATNVAAAGAVMDGDLGTGVATALAVNVGSAGAPVTFNGALGTPSSGTATNLTGTAAGLTAGAVEGTGVLSTGEAGGTKFLREDGDGTCSWQTPSGSGDVSKVGTPVNNELGVWTGDGTLEGEADLTFASNVLNLNGGLLLDERADHAATPTAGSGELWLSNDATQKLYLTDDAGTDKEVAFVTGGSDLSAYTGVLGLNSGTAVDVNTKALLEARLTDVADIAEADGDTWTGVHDFGGADSLEIPNSATPTVDADGEIAVDTTVTDFSHGVMKYYGGEEMGVVAMPIAQFTTPSDGYLVGYNATNDEFELVASAGGGNVSNTGTPADGQIGVWTSATVMEGDSALTFDTTDDTLVIAASGKLGFGAVDVLSDSAGTTTLQNIDAIDATTDATIVAALVGQEHIWVPATAMTPSTTNGAAAGSVETTTNDVMIETLDFDAATDEFAQFSMQMPKSWDEGTLVVSFVWSHPSTATNFDAIWGCQAVAFADGDALDTAWGTAVTVTDTGGTTDDLYITSETSAMTVAGTPGAEEVVYFRVYRDADAGGDTLAVDARLHGVKVHWTRDALNED